MKPTIQEIDEAYEVIACTEDKPNKGMWHCGSNPCWVTVLHNPTMMSVRAYHPQQHKARALAQEALQKMVEAIHPATCSHPEALKKGTHK